LYPRWFAARVTYVTLASPQHATGAGYVLFIRDARDTTRKNALEPYLLSSAGAAPFIETDAQGYAIRAALTLQPGSPPPPRRSRSSQPSRWIAAPATLKNPGNLADLRDQAYFRGQAAGRIGPSPTGTTHPAWSSP
jgi:hypothetical protein